MSAADDQEDIVTRFCAVAGSDPQTAQFLLDASGGDFEIALNTFFGMSHHA